ncbi:hypothetical protein PICMEDRAFT_70273 [Pichia membranifaciens NRRL Y-2026]|uniref:Uncharacterized protein n=1 Tax=Pichia membranifaciens NRRL Y-2026 TaxID=763406 RepID=A0A1E3NSV4_9ASCO|nr:hypothetical protein PICMEDRAFT_70273 [Pichia membranifaciens NRRL Y-2026]ODQ48653.1 hypothetical protein PICMEDRAFT_70273 [Pichia membranifaciens NRRL Y-2026]
MYIPPDLSRYNPKPVIYSQFLASSIYPVQITDPNTVFCVDKEEFRFTCLNSVYEPDVALRIARTPLSPSDPFTYAALSKFTEYYLRKFHSSTGAQSSNQIDKPPLNVPKELIAAQSDGKTEILLVGSLLNPLVSDSYKPVHLTPGCISSIVNFTKDNASHEAPNTLSNKLFGKTRNTKGNVDLNNKQPKTSLNRNSSAFIERIATCDNYMKKMSNAESLLISVHGRVLNIIALDQNPREIEIDSPCLRLILSNGIITCFTSFEYTTTSGEKNLDILFGFATGDILWLNPLRMKYSRWNKNGKIKSGLITSLQWSKCGKFAIAGFADGEVLTFSRNLEDPESAYQPTVQIKERHMRTVRSLKTQQNQSANPVAHYKFSKKPITHVTIHPIFHNVVALTSDDGLLRIFDLLTETITDIVPSYYAGLLVTEFTPDGKYIAVGGEDDIVSIFEFQFLNFFSSPSESGLLKLVTRLQGAKSWIKGIVIGSNGLNSSLSYTIGTASDDGYIRFYEFQPRALRKVKRHAHVASASYIGTPKFQMQRGFSNSSVEPSLDSRKKKLANRSSNTLVSMNNTNNHLSLLEIINQGSSSTSLQQLQPQTSVHLKLGENNMVNSSAQSENRKLELMKINALFKNKTTSAVSILLRDSRFATPHIHTVSGMNTVPNVLPVSEKNVNLGRLSGLHMSKEFVWAFVATGDLIRWKKHESYSNAF